MQKRYIRIQADALHPDVARSALGAAFRQSPTDGPRPTLATTKAGTNYYVIIENWGQLDLFLGYLRQNKIEFEQRDALPGNSQVRPPAPQGDAPASSLDDMLVMLKKISDTFK